MSTTVKTWRIMGMYLNDEQFLIVMGTSRADCEGSFIGALSDYTHEELKEVESAWLEEWARDCCSGELTWVPRVELPLRRLRLRAAAVHQHATVRQRRESEVAA